VLNCCSHHWPGSDPQRQAQPLSGKGWNILSFEWQRTAAIDNHILGDVLALVMRPQIAKKMRHVHTSIYFLKYIHAARTSRIMVMIQSDESLIPVFLAMTAF
jgi:hypothetical protein